MKSIVAGRVPVTATEFVELALGIDLELFTGPAVESPLERAARLDVAREVLAELRESDPETAAYAETLLRALPLKQSRPICGRTRRAAVRRPVQESTAVAA
ncbi:MULTISPECIES: hypothetical protein [Streptomyces]|uniref:hypothetical protein n=1 Tax=Streptomyces TaxID=1883 RepID=UPI00103F8F07|nr:MULTISPECIES: hypothetical protein [Streptomyces]MBT3076576.1 hypothetical protein [Streptomyces sp. COG21]MBT3078908.1 hypothetical protein [Streptomyces sp. COG20]MBT3087778.1 hypothetical protein [Streptomyces sp. CYG21]MBT3096518.1 hypothetical protein [Streptomyces sp. CBG30]MBT3107225.1 hypothetical protein [Streptomyces sp. COG19]